jgi:hypothetical protein
MVQVRQFSFYHCILFCKTAGTHCFPMVRQGNTMLEAHDSPLGGRKQEAAKIVVAIALQFIWPYSSATTLVSV